MIDLIDQLNCSLKVVKDEIQKPSACYAALFCCKFWVDVSRFSPSVINLLQNKTFVVSSRKLLREAECGSTLSFFVKWAEKFSPRVGLKIKVVPRALP